MIYRSIWDGRSSLYRTFASTERVRANPAREIHPCECVDAELDYIHGVGLRPCLKVVGVWTCEVCGLADVRGERYTPHAGTGELPHKNQEKR